MKKIKIGQYDVFFEKKARIKSIRLRFDKSGNLLLSAPYFCLESRAVDFALSQMAWIEKQFQNRHQPHIFTNGETISILGQNYTILHDKNHKRGTIIFGTQIIVGGSPEFLHRRIVTFAKEQLYVYIQQKAIEMGALINKKPRKITLRNTSSRWGSCSSRNDMNFCWKLVFAPLYVIDYIIAHEVSHLKEMNHSSAFWETVALFNVEQANAQIWLRRHGYELQAVQDVGS